MFHRILILGIFATTTNALECGITGDGNKDINKVIASCSVVAVPVPPEKSENVTKTPDVSIQDDLEEIPPYGPRRGIRRQKRSLEFPENPAVLDSSKNQTNVKDPNKCIPHCILEKLNALDVRGYPDHASISELLTENIENRELKDFFQDSIDDCFQVISDYLHDQTDTCACSAKLVICLAEKGKYNCADWPVGELPFPHNI